MNSTSATIEESSTENPAASTTEVVSDSQLIILEESEPSTSTIPLQQIHHATAFPTSSQNLLNLDSQIVDGVALPVVVISSFSFRRWLTRPQR